MSNQPAGKKVFHCKDVGYDCEWKVEGATEGDIIPQIEQHAAEVHNLTEMKDEALENIHRAIQRNSDSVTA